MNDRIVSLSITAVGRQRSEKLPYRRAHGDLGLNLRRMWTETDAFVLHCAIGIAVRIIGPLLDDKTTDPAVVCVDEAGSWVVPIAGGHHGANALATEVAALLGATAVLTTATDAVGLTALDTLPGFTAHGDIAGVTRVLLDGFAPAIDNQIHWPLPSSLSVNASPNSESNSEIVITDEVHKPLSGRVTLCPRSLVVGVGSSSGVSGEEVESLIRSSLTDAGLSVDAVAKIVSIDLKAAEAGIVNAALQLGVPFNTFPAAALSEVDVPNPSSTVQSTVGTPSVAEAAALLAAGPNAVLVVPKQRSPMATVAVARRARPQGVLHVIGLGPGHALHRTPAATAAVRNAEIVIGYTPYIDQCAELLEARHDIRRRPIGAEEERCREALQCASAGSVVALVCSGDAGIYAMASLVFELAPLYGSPEIHVVPGVTAALAAAAVLGAPLGHDHASISLSDLLTPWPVIVNRLNHVAQGDFVVTFYNPRSLRRTHQLVDAMDILRAHRPSSTPVAAVTDVGRSTQKVVRTTIDAFDPTVVDMLTCVVVGSSTSYWSNDHLVTPRGYIDTPGKDGGV